MKIAALSRQPKSYSIRRLREAAPQTPIGVDTVNLFTFDAELRLPRFGGHAEGDFSPRRSVSIPWTASGGTERQRLFDRV